MNRFLPTVLFLSSLIFLSGCSPLKGYKKTGALTPAAKALSAFTNLSKPILYRAEIDIANKHYSGLLLFKQLDTVKRLTFITEVGMSIFDFEIKDRVIRLVSIFEPLNKPMIVKVLSEDMQRIFAGSYDPSEEYINENKKAYKQKTDLNYYFFYGSDKTLDQMTVKGNLFKKAVAKYEYQEEEIPQTINYTRKSLVKIRIKLNKIEKNAS
jgi:hypothetical protein